jgi:hypothetical protein
MSICPREQPNTLVLKIQRVLTHCPATCALSPFSAKMLIPTYGSKVIKRTLGKGR